MKGSLKFNCTICLEEKLHNEFIKLKCDHLFCKECLVKDWTENINSKKVDDWIMKCPNQGCNVPINYYTLKGNLSPELYAEYDKLKAEAPELARKNEERSISCPKCNILSIIWIDADYFKCPSCGIQYCSNENCYGEWDKHQNMNCSQYKKKYTLSDQKMFEEFIKKKGWMQCPKCNVVIEKKGNCNTIRCESRKCCKKTLFCYTCGKELANDEMGPHFPNGDFQVCINVMPQNKIKNNPNEMLKNKDESIQPFLKKGKEVKKVEESKDFCSTLCDYLIYCCFPNKSNPPLDDKQEDPFKPS